MSYGDYLRDVLRPLGVYDLEAPFQGEELDAVGCGLDGAEAALEEIQREMNLETARDWGLERVAALFVHRPVAAGAEEMAAALAARNSGPGLGAGGGPRGGGLSRHPRHPRRLRGDAAYSGGNSAAPCGGAV